MKNIYDDMPEWNWCLNIEDDNILSCYLDDLMGVNEKHTDNNRLQFISEICSSLSLSIIEKKRVIGSYYSLSKFQLDELSKVFINEKERFISLSIEHPEDIEKLIYQSQLEWSLLLNEKDGEFVFIIKILDIDNIELNKKSYLIEQTFENFEKELKYGAIYYLSKKIISLNKNLDENFFVLVINNFLYSSVKVRRLKNIDDEYIHVINNYSIKKEHKAFLTLCFYNYISINYGVYDLDNFLKLFLKQIKSLSYKNYDILSSLSLIYLQYGSFDKAINASFKSISVNKNKKISTKEIKVYYSYNNGNFRRNVIRLIYLLYLSNDKKYVSLAKEIANKCYKTYKDLAQHKILDDVERILFLEIIIDKQTISKKTIFNIFTKINPIYNILYDFYHVNEINSESLRIFFRELNYNLKYEPSFEINKTTIFKYFLIASILIKIINKRKSERKLVTKNLIKGYNSLNWEGNFLEKLLSKSRDVNLFKKFINNKKQTKNCVIERYIK